MTATLGGKQVNKSVGSWGIGAARLHTLVHNFGHASMAAVVVQTFVHNFYF